MAKKAAYVPPVDPVLILRYLPVGLFTTDSAGVITWVNDTLCDQLGVGAAALIGLERNALPAKKTLSLSKTVDWLHTRPSTGTPERRYECITQKLKGDGSGSELGCVIDVSRYEGSKRPGHLFPELKDPGKLDPQTGLLSKTTMQQELISQVSRSRRYHNPLAVVLIRLLDNMSNGEAVAAIQKQRLSKAIAKMLKEKLRWVDIVGCWDKDEFMLILPETALEPANRLARKIRNYFAKLQKDEERVRGNDVSIAIGLAGWERGDDVSNLLARVEHYLEKPMDGRVGESQS